MEAGVLPSGTISLWGSPRGRTCARCTDGQAEPKWMVQASTELAALNAADRDAFVAALGGVFENAPWVAQQAHVTRPFATVADLHRALMAAVAVAGDAEQLAFMRGHPELGGRIARAGAMTAESRQEQGSLGLDRLSEAEVARFEQLNAAYRARFDMAFILCARRHTRGSILANFERRLA